MHDTVSVEHDFALQHARAARFTFIEPMEPTSRPTLRPKARSKGLAALFAVLVLAILAIRPGVRHVRAAALLLRFADEHAEGGLAGVGKRAIDVEDVTIDTAHGPAKARVYTPRGVSDAPGLVIVHGVHRLGIEEPRLTRFARAIASSGVVVLTPEVKEIADYRVDPQSIDTIGAAAGALNRRLGGGKAGVMGMSFAGGLSLLAAADPRFSRDIGFVVAVGAHHDLARVSRFFATNEEPQPDGSIAHLEAHAYGPLVVMYGHAERFFAAEDVPAARDAIRLWLWDERTAARAREADLGPASRATMDAVFDGHIDRVAPVLLANIDRDRDAMERVSPHGHLAAMTVPVFLLHGAGDTVIPAVETTWIAREVPAPLLRSALVSNAIVHVELGAGTSILEQWALVHFMAGVLAEAEAARVARSP